MAAQDERLSTLAEVVQKHHDHFTTLSLDQAKKFSEENAVQDERTEEHFKHFTELCKRDDKRYDERCAAIEASIVKTNATVDDHHTSVTSVCTDLEQNLSARIQDGVAKAEELRETLQLSIRSLSDETNAQVSKLMEKDQEQD